MIDDMRWSFSRIQCYDNCPYNFYLKYIKKIKDNDNAFSQYGKLCHNILEEYANGEIAEFELLNEYKNRFDKSVTKNFPYNKHGDLRDGYFKGGEDYFTTFEGFKDYKIVKAEGEVKFEIGGYDFIGYVDLVLKNKDNQLVILDHKSKKLSNPRKSTWENIDKRRKSELYQYLRQLYLYSKPLIEKYKVYPQILIFNSFKVGKWIEIPFDKDDYQESLDWALNIINNIYNDENMTERHDKQYFCDNICGTSSYCEYSRNYIGVEA